MLPPGFATFGSGLWTTWVPVGAGAVVTVLVIWSAVVYERWGRRSESSVPVLRVA